MIADPSTLQPLLVIEFEDASHSRPEHQTRDEEVKTILEAAGIAIIHVLPSRNYDTRELEASIAPYLNR